MEGSGTAVAEKLSRFCTASCDHIPPMAPEMTPSLFGDSPMLWNPRSAHSHLTLADRVSRGLLPRKARTAPMATRLQGDSDGTAGTGGSELTR